MALTKISTGMLKQDAASSDLNIDAGTLYIDVSNNRVGVANVAPAVPLHVSGDGTGLRLSGISPYTNGALLDFYHGGTRRGYIGSTGSGTAIDLKSDTGPLYLQASNNLQLFTGGSERVRVDSSGRVGIGTTNPSRKLDISAAGNDGIRIASANALIGGGGSGGDTQLIYWNGSNAYYGRASLGGSISQHEFRTGGTTRLTINSSGNVGIGTTSPAAKLHVSATDAEIRLQHTGNSYFQRIFTDSSNNLKFGTGANGTERMRIDSSGKILINETSFNSGFSAFAQVQITNSTAPGLVINTDTAGASNYGRLAFTVGNTTGNEGLIRYNSNDYHMSFWTNASEHMRITSGGNIGIGTTTSLVNKLNVNGNQVLLANGELRFADSTNSHVGTIKNSGSSGTSQLNFLTSSTERMRIDSSGNVGIGMTSPAYSLDFGTGSTIRLRYTAAGSAIRVGASDYDVNLIRFDGATGITNNGYFGGSLRYMGSRASNANSLSIFMDNTTGTEVEAMTVLQDGNVGIGSTSPDAKLEVAGGSTGIILSNVGDSSAYDAVSVTYSGYNSGTPEFIFQPKTAPGSGTINSFFRFKTKTSGGSNAANVTIDGSLGIGTTDPQEKLHVKGKALIQGGTGTTSTSELGFTNLFDTAFLRSKYTNPSLSTETYLAFHTNTSGEANGTVSEKMRLAGSNLGIGITNPTETLELTRLGKIGFGVNGDYGVRIGYFDDTNGVHGFHIDTKHGGTLTSESAFVVRANSNNVGIGTKNPAHALDIERTTGAVGIGLQARDDSSSAYINFGDNSDDDVGQIKYNHSSNALQFRVNASERMRIDSSGNVGINETSPDAYLHITGKTSYTTANSSEVSGLGFVRLQPNNNSEHSLWVHNAGNNLGISGYTDAATSSSRDMTLQTYGGDVGIGTTSPGVKLDVYDSTAAINIIRARNDSQQIAMGVNNAQGGAFLFVDTAHALRFGTSGSERMRITDTGYFRLNHNTAWDTLGTLTLRQKADNLGIGIIDDGSQNTLQIRNNGTYSEFYYNVYNPIIFSQGTGGGTERMRIDDNGRLGVNTDSPVSTLDVNGIVSIKGNNVIDSDGTSHYFKTPTGGAMYFYHGTTNPMVMTAAGVGMGATPSFTTGSGLRIERASNATLRLQDTGNHGYEIMASASDLTMRTMNNKPTRFKDSSGNTTLTINNHTGALTVGGTVGTNNVFRTYNITGPGSSSAFTRTIDVNTYWGFSAQGGIFYLGLHGWQTDIAVGAIQFHNNGSSSQVITGVSYHEMVTSSGISISVAKGTGDREIDITFTNAHSNTHGWIAKVWA